MNQKKLNFNCCTLLKFVLQFFKSYRRITLSTKEPLTARLDMRITESDKDAFVDKCSQTGVPYQIVMRNLIDAYNEDRITIKPKKRIKKQ